MKKVFKAVIEFEVDVDPRLEETQNEVVYRVMKSAKALNIGVRLIQDLYFTEEFEGVKFRLRTSTFTVEEPDNDDENFGEK